MTKDKQWQRFREKAGRMLNQGMKRSELASMLEATPKQLVDYIAGAKKPSPKEQKRLIQAIEER